MRSASFSILHCISSLEGGGAERQLGIIASAQAQHGHDVHVAFLRGGAHLAILENGGATLHSLPHRGNLDPALPLQLHHLIRAIRPSVVQTWLTQMDVLAGLAARLTRTPWVLAERSSALAYPPSWRQRVRSHIVSGADLIVANSGGGLEYWRTAAPKVPGRVIGNAVALDQIRTAEPASLPDRSVLFVGRLAEEKRLAALLNGYAATAPTSIGPLLICGDGYQRPLLEDLTVRLGLANRVQFLGFRSDVWSLMRGASCIVNPSVFEGCPNAVIEAMAAGRPVVVSDIPAHREILNEREAAIVNADDPHALATALLDSVTDSLEVRERVARATERVEALSVDSIRNAYDAAYRDVLAHREGH